MADCPFNADRTLVDAGLAIRDIGTYPAGTPLVVAIAHVSDPSVVVARPDGVTPDGLPYLDFVAPGLMAASAMQGGAGASLWPVMGGIKWMGTYQAMVATPVGPADVYDGVVVATTTRASIGAAAFVLIATVLGAVSSPWAIAAVPAAGLCAAAFAAPLTAFTATQENDLQFPLIMRIVVMPLFLFSGTFFPISQLPVGLRIAARFSPLWHGVELCRAATTGTVALGATAVHVSVLVACILAGATWGHRSFTRRLTP